jgi:hypothetical protein
LATGKPILFWFGDWQTNIILVWQPANQYYSGLATGKPVLFWFDDGSPRSEVMSRIGNQTAGKNVCPNCLMPGKQAVWFASQTTCF